jgi:rhodanese-related sulfurtransferase
MARAIAPAELAALMEGKAPHAVLDLRERGAYERGHIFRATALPRCRLETRLPSLVTAPSTPLALYDEDGSLSPLAAATLGTMGYGDVRILEGGLAAWRDAGGLVVQGLNVPSKVFGERVLHQMGTPEITPHELQERIASDADMVIVDARTPEEYARGCVPGAWSVPGGELVLRIAGLLKGPATTVVVHCGGRTRSYIGAESLRRMGLPNPIVALRNGTMGWQLAGLELERGAKRRLPRVSPEGRALAETVAQRVAAEEGVRLIAPEELRELLKRAGRENLNVLDVRTESEYAEGHVAQAIWAPGGQVIQAADEYIAVREADIVLVCDGLARSVMTAAWLGRMGFPKVCALAGGVPAWERSGGAMATGRPVVSPWGYEAARAAVPTVGPGPLGDALVLSVDPSDVYARGHLPGAGWLCRSRLERVIEGVEPDRTRSIVVSCADGVQSTLAAQTLASLGYGEARVLAGGTRAWAEVGLALERGLERLLDEPDDVVLKPYDRGRAAMEDYLAWEEALDEAGRSPHPLLGRSDA